ncbi:MULTISPECIES: hypothetical protein [unclassified Crossiella]|uniref:hypothetical protein n=1 Tax=unclassified Crossiella TaxID=2620835 RepID=UPI0020004802|nr:MULTISPECIES: hypothetical protein [unclassified Crossiella]MCK2242182.1 hypothetical protein [Crossiella sp. S99.2]MCK2256085.1 hypothetical protein [Crossiella sp. S99.1]
MGKLPTHPVHPVHPVVPPTGRLLRWLGIHRDLPPITRLSLAADLLDIQLQLGDPDAESLDSVLGLAPRAKVLLPALLAWHDVITCQVITVEDRKDAGIAYIRVHGLVPDELPDIPVTVLITLIGQDRDLLVAGLGSACTGQIEPEFLRALVDYSVAEGLPTDADAAAVTG